MSAPSLLLAGGGTAGHTSPLIATADELSTQRPDVRLTALGTARGLETTAIPAAGLALELIPPVPMPRQLSLDLALVGPRLLRAVQATVQVLRRVGAQAVLGFGGYVSTPAYLAARRLGLPIVVHEQNTMPGLANKLAARLTRAVYTSFPTTPLPHATCIGLPMRRGITELDRAGVREQARSVFDLPAATPVLLVSGGSQGAASINRAALGARERLLARGISMLHVLGPKNLTDETMRTVDSSSGAVYAPVGYVEQMEQAYAVADLMLGRSGANTVMETAAVGLPAVFVPYPHGNGEQALNAELVVDVGGGLLLADANCTSDWVANEIPALLEDHIRLQGMIEALAGVARTDAAAVLAARTLEVIG
ncbi:MAG TPA: undecaprenyldiphospho-muramoylpentapeptide beta-N-acetylglucosaminyltransferase [Propionibacteriaceae bacterium]|nr:undecaprenyldiphospho-muramoylpentapeptide beta-N-acetylglucosaminyltransferase [Propionibacteriaceae bacterium]